MKLKYRIKIIEFFAAKTIFVAQYKIVGIWLNIKYNGIGWVITNSLSYCETEEEAQQRIEKHTINRIRGKQWYYKEKISYNSDNSNEKTKIFKQNDINIKSAYSKKLRYGENPHQESTFFGNINDIFDQLHGKEISYNNLLDIDAAINLIKEFKDETIFVILKHNNACGCACNPKLIDAWKNALSGDPISAFGGILITNKEIDIETAQEINKIFYEVIIAPSYQTKALNILKSKKNRIILKKKSYNFPSKSFKSILNGVLIQDKDLKTETCDDMKCVTKKHPTDKEIDDLVFANILVKHSKSNTIVLVKNNQLIGSGVGQTSRVDSLKQSIEKANNFGKNLKGAVMASDAFFPFPDNVEIAHKAGITTIIQPGGSIKDNESIKYCDENKLSMVFTGIRHFRH